MPKQFRKIALRQLANLRMGATPSRAEPSFWARDKVGHPWVAIGDIRGKNLYKTAEEITSLGVRSARLQEVPAGIPIVSFKLTLGKATIPQRAVYTNEAIVALFPKEGRTDASWLYYAVPRAVQSTLTETAVKGQTLNLATLNDLRVPVPDTVTEQQRIAEILDTVDEEIDRTSRSLAKAKVTRDAVWADLYSQIDVPCAKLGDLLLQNPQNGYSPVEEVDVTGTFVLGLGCLTTDGFVPAQLKSAPAKDPATKRALLSNGDLLISRSNTRDLVGLVGRYHDIGSLCIYPDLMMRLRPTDEVRPKFLELTLRSSTVRRQIQSAAQGTSGSMVKINSSTVRNLTIRLPALDDQDRLLAAMEPLDEVRRGLERRLDKLRLLKKGLMDDLLSGKVRVCDMDG